MEQIKLLGICFLRQMAEQHHRQQRKLDKRPPACYWSDPCTPSCGIIRSAALSFCHGSDRIFRIVLGEIAQRRQHGPVGQTLQWLQRSREEWDAASRHGLCHECEASRAICRDREERGDACRFGVVAIRDEDRATQYRHCGHKYRAS